MDKNKTYQVKGFTGKITIFCYNYSEGWSVFTGTVMNEEEWAKRNSEAYQRYLQEKKSKDNKA